jgi:hypothetical protein
VFVLGSAIVTATWVPSGDNCGPRCKADFPITPFGVPVRSTQVSCVPAPIGAARYVSTPAGDTANDARAKPKLIAMFSAIWKRLSHHAKSRGVERLREESAIADEQEMSVGVQRLGVHAEQVGALR